MPLYDFTCPLCQHHQERLQKSDDPSPPCPVNKAHGPMERQVPRKTTFHLQGSGWARDGYK